MEITKQKQNKALQSTRGKKWNLNDVVKLVAYGTQLREAIDRIAKAKTGGLIVISEKGVKISEGGFKINTKLTSQKLAELSKMDGAIIVDSDAKKILCANVMLIPDPKLPSAETGTRHKAAERTARQLDAVVIAISEKSSTATLYFGPNKYTLTSISELLSRASNTLVALERQRKIFDEVIARFDRLEPFGLITLNDIATLITHYELVNRISKTLQLYINELGKEATSLQFQFLEIIKDIDEIINNVVKDYEKYVNLSKLIKQLKMLKRTPDINTTAKMMKKHLKANVSFDEPLMAKGYRLLKKIPGLTQEDISNVIQKFGSIKFVVDSNIEQLVGIKGIGEKKAKAIKEWLIKITEVTIR